MSERRSSLAESQEEIVDAPPVEVPASANKVDRDLVDRSVSHIREIIAKTVSAGQDEVGQYLLREFYDNDPEAYRSQMRTKHASLRKLMDRCESVELPVSRTFLVNAMRLAVATRALPRKAAFNQLPPSHRVELLRVKAPEKVEKLAARAMQGGLSVQKLRVLVQKAEERKADAPGKGRVAAPSMVKAVEGCLRLLRDEESGKLLFRRGDLAAMTEEQRTRAQTAFKVLDKRVGELRKILS